MPTDRHGNEYLRMIGRSRLVTNEQRLAIAQRPHEERGCCDSVPDPPRCCRPLCPSVIFHQDGDEWTCPVCGTVYVADTDEAEGSAWWPVVVPSENADSPGEPHTEVPVAGN